MGDEHDHHPHHRWEHRGCANVERQMSRGDSLVFQVQATQPVNAPPIVQNVPFVPTDVTGWKFWFTLKYNFADPDYLAVAQITPTGSTPLGGSVTVLQATTGIIQVLMPPAATVQFPDSPVTCLYDIQVLDTFGNTFTIERGTVTVYPDVTRVATS